MFDRVGETLVDLLRMRAEEQADRRAFAFLTEDEEVHLTYAELDRKARALGTQLQKLGQVGDRALLLYQPGIDYLVAFFGCLYAGLLAVPAYPPRLNGSMDRLQAIVSDSEATIALTSAAILSKVEGRFADAPGLGALTWVETDSLSEEMSDAWQQPLIDTNTLAFLQYTSGSTSLPKGVMLTHGNLLHNLQLIHESFGTTPESECVIWLPPYHDMGLIGGILSPLYTGFPVTLMSPFAFMQRPLLWLETISKKGATLSGGPNFAYDLCVQKITAEQKATLDLSQWKTAFTGAEPVRQDTLDRFVEAFAECGFTREAFYPCYGLAEATLFVTGGQQEATPIVQAFAGEALEEHRVLEGDRQEPGARTLVGCGHVRAQHQQVLVVDPQSLLPVAEDQVGEIWVSGPSVAQGYWKRPEQTEETFRAQLATGEGPFLRTGDLGFLRAGELYITGRLKDLIIIRGRNYYPQDLEYTVQDCHVALRPGCGAAFSVEVEGEERLVIVQEVERAHRKSNLDEVVMQIREKVAQEHELQVHAVVLIKPASSPLTSSGKIQRHACKERFLNGTLDVMASHSLHVQAEEAMRELSQVAGMQDDFGLGRAGVESADAMKEVSQVAGLQDDFGSNRVTLDLNPAVLQSLEAEKRQSALASYLLQQMAQILKMSPSRIDAQKPVTSYGLDSLMAVELRNVIEEQFAVVLPLVDFLDGPSVEQLAAEVLKRLDASLPTVAPSEAQGSELFLGNDLPLSYGQRSLWFMQRLAP
ncbi:MAG: AMP-binding protein, partial [Tumebacillaceae bacterium]